MRATRTIESNWFICAMVLTAAVAISCQNEDPTLFRKLKPEQTGIKFSNDLRHDQDFNIYTYRNYYNGGGVAIGDINNDGLVDIYFTANQLKNRLFLNLGSGGSSSPFHFKDITEKAGVGGTRAWSTGVTMADVNGDGWLDIYVCNSGDIKGDNKQNELFINNRDLTFTESAEAYNLADQGYSTHASFFDYDKDGDLDAYLLNNSYQAIGSFNLRRNERPERDPAGGDKLMMNTGGTFTDISEKAGIYGSIIGFGLGVTVGDLNGDTWDDIYVSNDFFERDYLYINQQNGTFKECLTSRMQSISAASMGADIADINNDGNNDLMVTEMLPHSQSRLKSAMSFDDWSRYRYLVRYGYFHQFMRNTLQLNNGDSTFSEIGRLAGVEASDWSWGALMFDMENDGLRDIFIANGIFQDLTDQDYLQYVSSEEVVKSMVSERGVDYERLIELIPSNPIENQAYKNRGNLRFELGVSYGLNTSGFSNGAAYGDLDNDGDLDLIVNNVNMQAFIYENTTDKIGQGNYLKLVLKGTGMNPFAIGAKIKVQSGSNAYYAEIQPTRGYQSGVDLRPNIGLPTDEPVVVTIIWPTGKRTLLRQIQVNQTLIVLESDPDIEEEVTVNLASTPALFTRQSSSIPFIHKENAYVDFDLDRLQYHMKSTDGPKMSVADVNDDGLEDLYIGGSRGIAGTLLIKTPDGYRVENQEAFENDRSSEDAESIFFDADGDGDHDLYVCSGGVEFLPSSPALNDRLYINNGDGSFVSSGQRLPSPLHFLSSSSVSTTDIDKDGDLDLFVGERIKPGAYGATCSGFILHNDGMGQFTDVTSRIAPDLVNIGMITDGRFSDLDGDGDEDLVVTGEFMGVELFRNDEGIFSRQTTPDGELKGWWNVIYPVDIDGDGDQDIVAGNHGLNSRFHASAENPLVLYVDDFDENGTTDPVFAMYDTNGEISPMAHRRDLIGQLSAIKKKFPDHQSYKNATITDVFSEDQLRAASKLTATTMESLVLINDGNFRFTPRSLPIEVQFAPIYAIAGADYDKDGDMDLLLGGNLYGAKPEVGRYDASFGIYLENLGNLNFRVPSDRRGFWIQGEVRDIVTLKNEVIISRNSDSLVIFSYH